MVKRSALIDASMGGRNRRAARALWPFRLSPKKGAEFFAEDEAGAGEGDGEEDHRPHAEGAGDIATFTKELK